MPGPGQARPESPAALAVVRLGILGGVLALGGVAWHLTRQPGWSPASVDRDAFFYAGLVVWAAATAGLLLLRSRWQRETEPARRTPLMIVGWALGEVPAVWGGVQYLLTGDPQRYFTGLMFLVMAFLLLPVRARS
jgi:hypothetical protein